MPLSDDDLDDLDRLVSELNLAGPRADAVDAKDYERVADGGLL
jgi:hypothetical protein